VTSVMYDFSQPKTDLHFTNQSHAQKGPCGTRSSALTGYQFLCFASIRFTSLLSLIRESLSQKEPLSTANIMSRMYAQYCSLLLLFCLYNSSSIVKEYRQFAFSKLIRKPHAQCRLIMSLSFSIRRLLAARLS